MKDISMKMTTLIQQPRNTNGMFHPAARLQHSSHSMSSMGRRLFDAIRDSHMMQVKVLVYKNQININTTNSQGENSLIEALRIKDEKKRRVVFSFLLKCGIDVHHRDKVTDRDSLEWAAKLGREKQALQLLNGPMMEYDFMHRDCEGLTVLHHASHHNLESLMKAVIKRLARYLISVDIPDSCGVTPYTQAKRLGHDNIAQELAMAGASIHRADNYSSHKAENKSSSHFENQAIKLKINGRLPQLKRLLEVTTSTRVKKRSLQASNKPQLNSQYSVSDVSSLLHMKKEGVMVESFVHSTKEDIDQHTTTGVESTNSSHHSTNHNNSVIVLSDIFSMAAEQMTRSFCKPAQRPKPKKPVFQKIKPSKRSTLAAIMRKPTHDTPGMQSDRKKAHSKKFSAKSDLGTKFAVIPSIVTSTAVA